jgi:translin
MTSFFHNKDFALLNKELDTFNAAREQVIRKSRDVVIMSKKIISAVHRGEIEKAAKLKSQFTQDLKSVQNLARKHAGLYHSGSTRIAEQEYVEAIALLGFAQEGKVPSFAACKVDPESYLMGLCDLTGELVRRAINAAINEQYSEAVHAKECVAQLYDELLMFTFRGGELRKKFDSIKYDLKKLEDLILDLKLKDLV